MKNALRAVGATLIAALALAGCVRVESDIEIFSDDTVSQTSDMALAREIFELDGGDPNDALGEIIGSADQVRSVYDEIGLDVVIEEIDTADEIGLRLSYEHQPIDLVSDPRLYADTVAPPSTFERVGDTLRIEIPAGSFDEALGDEEVSLDQLGLFMTVRTTYTFPGEIIEHRGGTVDGNSITFTLADLVAGEDLYAVGKATGSTSLPIWIWAVLALLLIAAVATLLIVQDRRSKAAPIDAPPPGAPPAAGTPASTATTPATTAVKATPRNKPAAKKPSATTKAPKPGAKD